MAGMNACDYSLPQGWTGRTGFIDSKNILAEVPDYKERIFYISGPHSMVNAVKNTLKNIGLPGKQIKTDFFQIMHRRHGQRLGCL